MTIVQLFKQNLCVECGAIATRKLELINFDEGTAEEPIWYCGEHIPEPLREDDLRQLLDRRDEEIAFLKEKLTAAGIHF